MADEERGDVESYQGKGKPGDASKAPAVKNFGTFGDLLSKKPKR